jgi:ariadne-1
MPMPPQCGQSFCWLCGTATGRAHTWQSIEGHQCGRYKDEHAAKADEAMRLHKRYMHYFERFKGHADSHRKEKVDRVKLLEVGRSGASAQRTGRGRAGLQGRAGP